MDNSNIFKVRLESYSHGTANFPTSSVQFAVQPIITESFTVEYQTIDPVHMPGGFLVYKGTKATTYELSDIKLISRNSQEATDNQAIRNTLRGWSKPYFGFGTASGSSTPTTQVGYDYQKVNTDGITTTPLTGQDIQTILTNYGGNPAGTKLNQSSINQFGSIDDRVKAALTALDASASYQQNAATQKYKRVANSKTSTVQQQGLRFLGAPPEVLYLTAYSSAINNNGTLDKFSNITRVPCVITGGSITWPNDTDYIPTKQGEPFPIIMNLSLSLTETHSPQEYESFDIFKYREGRLPGF